MSLSPALLERLSRVPITPSLPSQTTVIAFACGQSLRSAVQRTLHRHTREHCKNSPFPVAFPPCLLSSQPGNCKLRGNVGLSRSRWWQGPAQNCLCTLECPISSGSDSPISLNRAPSPPVARVLRRDGDRRDLFRSSRTRRFAFHEDLNSLPGPASVRRTRLLF